MTRSTFRESALAEQQRLNNVRQVGREVMAHMTGQLLKQLKQSRPWRERFYHLVFVQGVLHRITDGGNFPPNMSSNPWPFRLLYHYPENKNTLSGWYGKIHWSQTDRESKLQKFKSYTDAVKWLKRPLPRSLRGMGPR